MFVGMARSNEAPESESVCSHPSLIFAGKAGMESEEGFHSGRLPPCPQILDWCGSD
jgi:hypothetical protein